MTTPKKRAAKNLDQAHSIVFGFDRATDEKSLQLFLQRFARDELLTVLIPRLQDKDILKIVDFVTAVMHNYLSEEEYHTLFLAE